MSKQSTTYTPSFPENSLTNDSQRWQAFKMGDKQAFEQIYTDYFSHLVNYGSRLTNDEALLEDAIQDVFIELWRRREFLTNVENLKFYLFKALRNQLSRNTRKDVFENAEDIDNFLDLLSSISVEQQAIEQDSTQEQVVVLENALSKLTNRQREAINLRFYHGLSIDEIASLMNVTKQAVNNTLSKSYAVLRLSLKALSYWFCLITASLS